MSPSLFLPRLRKLIGLLKGQLLIGAALGPASSAIAKLTKAARIWNIRKPDADTTYVFVFLGEFGYEVFNWQGVVRKFSALLPPSSRVVIGGRRGLQAFYETASEYIDISGFEPYRNSIAASYFALPEGTVSRANIPSPAETAFDAQLRRQIQEFILGSLTRSGVKTEFIFSSSITAFEGCIFGADRMLYNNRFARPGKIYSQFGILRKNNAYGRIQADISGREKIEKSLGMLLSEKYVLVQLRQRVIGPQVGNQLDPVPLISKLAERFPVILLQFKTGRLHDSGSSFGSGTPWKVYEASSFGEQSCLIHHAYRCVFFNAGDLGSHCYLPPFLGKDVAVVASKEMFKMPSAALAGWNKNVFGFGGKMLPVEADSAYSSEASLADCTGKILA